MSAKALSEHFLTLAVVLYTRCHPKDDVRLGTDPPKIDMPSERLHIDNGERGIILDIKYGPLWEEGSSGL